MMTSKSDSFSAYQQAIKILSRRSMSVYQLNERLLKTGYHQEEIDSAIKKLIDWKYLNDYEYTLSYCKSKLVKYSRSKVKGELLEAGISTELIDQIIEDIYTEGIEYQNCMRLGQKFLKEELARWNRKSSGKELFSKIESRPERANIPKEMIIKKRIGDRLITRGYAMAVVIKVISHLMKEKAFLGDL